MPKFYSRKNRTPKSEEPDSAQRQFSHSQNFLRNAELVQKLIKKSSLSREDVVIEIGAGRGIITDALAAICKKVIAIEADTLLAATLRKRFKATPNVEVISSDVLHYNLPKAQYKIFSNIPFNITADIIKKINDASNPPMDTYLIVQEEAAKKYAGQPYAKESLFSVLHKPLFRFELVHRFHKTDFSPIPHVNSVLLRIQRLNETLIDLKKIALFRDFVAVGFTRNPHLKKAYKNIFGHTQFLKLANNLRFSPNANPTDLSFEQWLAMFNYFLVGVDTFRQSRVIGSLKRITIHQQKLTKRHRTRNARDWRRASY
ncbi:MAG: 23S ribosomal RNA methyltransferase Erm [Patescibacteria group bacterium]|nr:23S ribosomal RNA methyltransferase Erm [Patescibacteria group bacterium]